WQCVQFRIEAFCCSVPGKTREPFRVRELLCEIARLHEFQIGSRRRALRHLNMSRRVEIVSNRANSKRGLAGFKLGRRKPIASVFVADDGDRDRRIDFLRGARPAQRPNLLRNPNLTKGHTAERWFDTDTFAMPAPFTFGNAGRNIVYEDGERSIDVSVTKQFRIKEGKASSFVPSYLTCSTS